MTKNNDLDQIINFLSKMYKYVHFTQILTCVPKFRRLVLGSSYGTKNLDGKVTGLFRICIAVQRRNVASKFNCLSINFPRCDKTSEFGYSSKNLKFFTFRIDIFRHIEFITSIVALNIYHRLGTIIAALLAFYMLSQGENAKKRPTLGTHTL